MNTPSHTPTVPAPPIIQSRRLDWSHEALQEAEFALPLHDPDDPRTQSDPATRALCGHVQKLERLRTDQRRVGLLRKADDTDRELEQILPRLRDSTRTVGVHFRSFDGGYTRLPELTDTAVANWLFASPAARDAKAGCELTGPDRAACCRDLAAAFEQTGLQHADPSIHGSRQTEAEQAIRQALTEGLRARLGQQVTGPEELVYFHAVARGLGSSEHRLCERCQTVIAAPRARKCHQCRHSPPRPKPTHRHTAIYPADPTAQSQTTLTASTDRDGQTTLTLAARIRLGSSRTTYEASCQECGETFLSNDARRRYCTLDATPAARTRRHRSATQPHPRR